MSNSVLKMSQKFPYAISTLFESWTDFQSSWLRLERKFSMLFLEKFRHGSVLALALALMDGSSMKTGKWSLMSETMTPLLISWVIMLVRI